GRRRLRKHGQLSITTFWVEASAAKCVSRRQARTPQSRGNPPEADVIWSPREGWAVHGTISERFRTAARTCRSVPNPCGHPGRGRLHVRQETSRVHHAARWRGFRLVQQLQRVRARLPLPRLQCPQTRRWKGGTTPPLHE